MSKKKPRLCIIVHPPIALTLLRKQWTFWQDHGFEVSCISGPSPEEHEKVRQMGVRTFVVPMERYPSPFKDIVSLARIWWLLLWHRFDIIHVSVLKSSLLGAVAAFLTGHRRIYYLVRGRTYENMTGCKRRLMNVFERVICRIATVVVPICHELGDVLVEEKLCKRSKIRVLKSGSSAGIDLSRFTRTPENIIQGKEIRTEYGILDSDIVILAVGWIRKDKGTNELITAYNRLSEEYPNLHLMLLGNYEPTDLPEKNVIEIIEKHPRIHHVKWRTEPVPVYATADILAFPSYREGFGNAAMEGSAMELPVVTSDIMGCREAVKNGVTGILTPLADADALYENLKKLIDNPDLRTKLAQGGRQRVEQEFKQELIWEATKDLFDELLEK